MAKLKIEYYKLNFTINNQLVINEPDNDIELKNKFREKIINESNKYIKNEESEYLIIDDSDNFIEFLESNDDYVFGILGKSDEVTKDILKRIKNKENLDVSGLFLEKYNYFYVKKDNFEINVIRNSSSPGFKRPFNIFLNNLKLDRIEYVNVTRVLDENINHKIKRMKSLLSLNFIFDEGSNLADNFLSLNDVFNISNSNLYKASVNVKFKNEAISPQLESFLLSEDRIKSDFKKFEIEADGQDGQETLELVGRWLTKSIDIELEDKDLLNDNLSKIKEALEKSFIN